MRPSKPGDPSARAFAAELKRRRTAQGMLLNELAARAGLAANHIGSIEKGARDPLLSTVFKLARGLGVKPGELFENGEHSSEAMEAASLFDAITDSAQRKAVMKLIRASAHSGSPSKAKGTATGKRPK